MCSLAYVYQFNSSIEIITQVLAIKRNKTNTQNTTKKIDIRYLCVIVGDV